MCDSFVFALVSGRWPLNCPAETGVDASPRQTYWSSDECAAPIPNDGVITM
jgi:hypothetical protein